LPVLPVAGADATRAGAERVGAGSLIAAASSYMDRPVRGDVLVVGEVGLTGEVRAVTAIETRLREGAALGFQRAVVPLGNVVPGLPLEVDGVATVTDALEALVR
jgi:DNA repair protein RadA/Sms